MTSTLRIHRRFAWVALLALAAFAAGCGPDEPAAPEAGAPDDAQGHSHAAGPHGGPMGVVGDHIAHLEAVHDEEGGDVRVWVMDMDNEVLEVEGKFLLNLLTDEGTTQVEGESIGDGWLFADAHLIGHPETARFRFSMGGKSYSVDLPHGEHAHEHEEGHAEHGPHEGTVVAFQGPDGAVVGYVELKLHDDKGDLELWIATDEGIATPFDLGLDAEIGVVMHDHGDKAVTLKVRNADQNEDEDGTPNNRGGKTNYFIFPGDTGADAAWLMGLEFASDVTVTFEKDGKTYTAGKFHLVPHTHAAGGHDHD